MPLQGIRTPGFRGSKVFEINWDGFRGGWNDFGRETEIDSDELAEARNLMLTGVGVPTKRWGSDNYFLSGATGGGRGLKVVKKNDGTEEILGLTDWGYLTKKNGASYTVITGASFATGYNAQLAQLDNNVYIMNGQREMIKYDFTSLVAFQTIAKPTGLAASNISGGTGARTQSWAITATTNAGETLGSTPVSLVSLPQFLDDTTVYLQWTPVSAASGVVTGYNIYRGLPGEEKFLGSVESDVTEFYDDGTDTSILKGKPLADSTGGPVGKYIIRFQDRLVTAGFPDDPTRIEVSGRAPDHERFDWASGGGYVLVDPDDGDEITGLVAWRDSIIVFKERSVFQVSLNLVTIGNFTVLEPVYRLLTASQGCSSYKTIKAVENDIMFVNRRGVFILGQEPRIQDTTLRTNEISSKIRPFFESLSETDITECSAAYVAGKYVVFFPESKRAIMFDRERGAFMGPWTIPFGVRDATDYVDSNNNEILLAIDSDDPYVTGFRKSYQDDKGLVINTRLKTRKENYGAWDRFKVLEDIYLQFRNVFGEVDISIYTETRSSGEIVAKEFSLTADAARTGWGIDQWGTAQWGLSNEDAQSASDELIRKAVLNKTVRTYQIEISTNERVSNYELLNVKSLSHIQGLGIEPADTWVVHS